MKGWLLLIAIPFLLRAEIAWQADVQKPYSLSIKLSAEKIYLDDFLYLDAEFRYPSSHQLDMKALVDQLAWSANPLAPRLSVYRTSVSSLKADEGVTAQQLHAVLRPLAQGPLDISFLNISFQPKDNTQTPFEVLTPVFTIQVSPIVGQPSLDLAPLITLEPEFPLGLTESNRQFLRESPERQKAEKERLQRAIDQHTFPWVTLAVLLGLGGIGWTGYLMRDRLPKLKRKEPLPPSAKQKAEKALEELQGRKLIDQGLTQVHAIELSAILLDALEARAGRNLKELTALELSQTMNGEASFSKIQKEAILPFLSTMDRIKFAGKKPSPQEAEELTKTVQHVIRDI